MDVEGQNLCFQCQQIDLSPMLFREARRDCWPYDFLEESRNVSDFELGPLNSMFYKAKTCDFCKVFCEILEDCIDADDLAEKRSHQREYHCSLFWHQYLRARNQADTPYYNPPKEAIYRMSIELWYLNEDGKERRISIPCLRDLFQPAPWPVPQLNPAEKPSRFWNNLRNGRLRSPICEPKILRTWLHNCESSHPMCWWIGPKTSLRLRLFDVKFRCVRKFQISLDDTVRYVALSYVWGLQAQRQTLTRSNYDILSKKGAIKPDDLSRTISDAAAVVEMLGERYLWADSLCILQDDQDDLAAQIPVMGQIFARSLVTIVAAASIDANSGLPGVSTQARSIQRILGPVKGGVLLRTCIPKQMKNSDVGPEFGSHYLENSKWDTRGWTFQEKLLSRRCLYFMKEQVYWECQCGSWCEETCLETSSGYRFEWESRDPQFVSARKFPPGKRMAGEDAIWAFSALIENYTSRTLTYELDGYRAFSGLLQILENLTGASIFWGIHVSEFSRILCWHNEESATLRPGETFPSWSWLAWTGHISLTSQGPQNHIAQIACYRVCSDGSGVKRLIPVSHDSRQDKSDTLSVDALATNVMSQLRDDFHIVFWAESALLSVPHTSYGDLYHVDPNLNPPKGTYRRIGFMYAGRRDRMGAQEFLLIRSEPYDDFQGHENPRKINLLMISWHDGIARREGVASFDAHEWTRANTQRKLIVMG